MFKLIYKKPGISSFKEINNFQKENKIKKIGHSGTLDLLAEGLLLVATDEDTKLLPYLKNKDKQYYVKAKLGYVSKTYDAEGPIEKYSDYVPTLNEVKEKLNNCIGLIQQIPPIFSAKKIKGKKAYELARKGQDIQLKPMKVNIYQIDKVKYIYPNLEFVVTVSNGTYIRTLIHDLGIALSTGAYITYLERTMVNGLKIDDEIKYENIIDLQILNLSSIQILKSLFNGLDVDLKTSDGKYLLQYENENVGIIEIKNNKITNKRLFGNKILAIINK